MAGDLAAGRPDQPDHPLGLTPAAGDRSAGRGFSLGHGGNAAPGNVAEWPSESFSTRYFSGRRTGDCVDRGDRNLADLDAARRLAGRSCDNANGLPASMLGYGRLG